MHWNGCNDFKTFFSNFFYSEIKRLCHISFYHFHSEYFLRMLVDHKKSWLAWKLQCSPQVKIKLKKNLDKIKFNLKAEFLHFTEIARNKSSLWKQSIAVRGNFSAQLFFFILRILGKISWFHNEIPIHYRSRDRNSFKILTTVHWRISEILIRFLSHLIISGRNF